MIVATAGHIDHGKTSLLRALTGVDCDRLPEEKARGISIDLGFAYWRCATGDLIGFVDVPGHEKFIRNMLAGVCGIDFALLVVAADDGVMPQTIEHVQVLDLLAIPRGAVVVTKTDLVSQERLASVQGAVRSLLADTSLAGAPVLSVSSVTGAGLEALKACLTDAARHQQERAVEGRLFRLAVDRAFTVAGSGTVVTGTVFSGEAHVGDRLQVAPAGPAARVRGIRIHQQAVTRVQAGQRCAINLAGPTREQVSRGDWLLHEELQAPTQRIDVRLRVSDSTEAALAHWSRVQLHLGTSAVMARVAITRGESIAPGAERRVQLVLEQPAIALHGDRFVVRDAAARRTVGGGVVLDPFAPATRRLAPARLAWLDALERGTPEAALEALLAIPAQALDVERFRKTFGLTRRATETLLRKADATLLGPDLALPRGVAAGLRDSVTRALGAFHQAQPQEQGLELESLRQQCAAFLPAVSFGVLLRDLASAGAVAVAGSRVRLARHVAASNPEHERTWARVLPLLAAAGARSLKVAELVAQAGVQEAGLREVLQARRKAGELLLVAPDRFYLRSAVGQLAASAAQLAAAQGGMFSAAQFKDAVPVGRTLAIEILEHLDAIGVTQRVGELRRMRRNPAELFGECQPFAPAAQPPAASPVKVPPRPRAGGARR